MKTPLSHSTASSMLRLFASCLALGMPLAAKAELTANFSDGVGTTDPSTQFVGAAGAGWTTSWELHSVNMSEFEQAVSTAKPFTGLLKRFDTDRYLNLHFTSGSASDSKRTSLSRGYGFGSGLAAGSTYEIAFNIRFDNLGSMGSGDYFGIFDSTTRHQTGTSHGSQSWGVVVQNRSLGLYSGARDGTSPKNISTGIQVLDGAAYSFVITVDPVAGSWYAKIFDEQELVYESDELGFRTMGGLDANRYILFNTLQAQEGDSWEYSLDGLTIIPEPGAAVALLGLAVAGLTLLRRRTH